MSKVPVTEAELHAYVDGLLPEARRAEIEAYLASRPEEAERVNAYRAQGQALHTTYDPVLDEPVPARLLGPARRSWSSLHYAAVAASLVIGTAVGWQLHGMSRPRAPDAVAFARQAAIAHAVYSPEVRHPVEVGVDQEAHLVGWLSKRLGTQIRVPHLGATGYALVGGRLLPGDKGPVAQFMYQDAKGQRLTLYVRANAGDNRETAFRFARENNVSVFYWVDGRLGYALSGECDKQELLQVATAVYRQLNP